MTKHEGFLLSFIYNCLIVLLNKDTNKLATITKILFGLIPLYGTVENLKKTCRTILKKQKHDC